MDAYANCRNNDLTFVSGGIYAPMRSVRPKWGSSRKALRLLRLFNFIIHQDVILKNH